MEDLQSKGRRSLLWRGGVGPSPAAALLTRICLDDFSKAAAQVDGGAPEPRHKLVRGQLRGALNRHWSPGRGGGSNLIFRYGEIQGRGGERMEEMIWKIQKHFPRHRSLLSFRKSLQEVTLILQLTERYITIYVENYRESCSKLYRWSMWSGSYRWSKWSGWTGWSLWSRWSRRSALIICIKKYMVYTIHGLNHQIIEKSHACDGHIF